MNKRIAIIQSNYIPWKGYFDIINMVDEFILYDDLQYTRRDWRNRNKIKTAQGELWLTIPVEVKGRYLQKIKDTMVGDQGWAARHWKSIVHAYSRSRYFTQYQAFFEELYLGCSDRHLSAINHRFLTAICGLLGIRTRLTWSMNYRLAEGKTVRLVDLCVQAGATSYLSGPSARDYIQEDLFKAAGIELLYMDYSGYPEYRQVHPPFSHQVSIIDLILNEGPDSRSFLKSFVPEGVSVCTDTV